VTQKNRIMRAILAGAQTSSEIADAIGACRGNVSVALHRLADGGLIERAGVVNIDRIGRPHVRWRLRASMVAGGFVRASALSPSDGAPAK
jgi:predicted ArsR family transcriptional regulator